MASPISYNLAAFFKDIIKGSAKLQILSDSRYVDDVSGRMPTGIAKVWDVPWNSWITPGCMTNTTGTATELGVVQNQTAGSSTTQNPTITNVPTALPAQYNGTTGAALKQFNDKVFTSNPGFPATILINEFKTDYFKNANWSDGVAMNAKWIGFSGTGYANIDLYSYRNGVQQTTQSINLASTSGMITAAQTCGSGTGAMRMNTVTNSNPNTKYLTQYGVYFYRNVFLSRGVEFFSLSNGGLTCTDYAETGANDRFNGNINNLSYYMNGTHLIVDLGENTTAAEQADVNVLKAKLEIGIDRIIASSGPTITKVLILSQYATTTYAGNVPYMDARTDAQYALAVSRGWSFYNQYLASGTYASLFAAGYIPDGKHPSASGSIFFMTNLWNAGVNSVVNSNAYNRMKLVTGGSLNGL